MIKNWEPLSREMIFKKYYRGIEKVDFLLPNGAISDFYIKKESNAVCILAITNNLEIVLVKQFRPGPEKTLSELPGGFLEEGQESVESAKRELLEETGFTGEFTKVTDYWENSYSQAKNSVFVCQKAIQVQKQRLDPNEFIEIETVSLDSFRLILRSGQMTNIQGGYLALDYLNLL